MLLDRQVAYHYGVGRYVVIKASEREEEDIALADVVFSNLSNYQTAMVILFWDRETAYIPNRLVSFQTGNLGQLFLYPITLEKNHIYQFIAVNYKNEDIMTNSVNNYKYGRIMRAMPHCALPAMWNSTAYLQPGCPFILCHNTQSSETGDNNIFYVRDITDPMIVYNNFNSGLEAFTVQEALDKLAEQVSNIEGIEGPQGPKGDTGEKGADGAQGPAGYTPVRGTDYWTEADQQAIIEAVLAQVPTVTYPDGEEVAW